MTWFKADDGFYDHPKFLKLSNAAVGLWAKAGSWCGRYLTDGVIPASQVKVLKGTANQVSALIEVGLWVETELDSGAKAYRFHDWDDYQPTREQKLKERADAAERQRESRERKRQKQGKRENVTRDSHEPVTRDSHECHTNLSQRPDPTRPDPSPSEVQVAGSADGEQGAGELASMIDFVVRDRPDCRPGLTRSVEALIRSGRSVEDVRAGLDAWWRRPDAGPGLLAHLVADAQDGRQADADTAATKAAAEAKAQAIASCRLCDQQGWILLHEPVLPCSHTESGNEEITLQADSEPPEPARKPSGDQASRARAALAQLRGGNDA